MDSGDLTDEQRQQIHDAIVPAYEYLCRLLKRMQFRSFPVDDKLWQLTLATREDLLAMLTELRTGKRR